MKQEHSGHIRVDILCIGSGAGISGYIRGLLDSGIDEDKSILIIERGQSNDLHSTISTHFVDGIGDSISNEKILLEVPSVEQVNCNNRKIQFSETNCLGGGSALNGMVFTIGARSDYDVWPEKYGFDSLSKGFNRLKEIIKPEFPPESTLSQKIIENAYTSTNLQLFNEEDMDNGLILNGIGYQRTNATYLDTEEFWVGYRNIFFEKSLPLRKRKYTLDTSSTFEPTTTGLNEPIVLKPGVYIKTEHEACQIVFQSDEQKITKEPLEPKYVIVKDMKCGKQFNVFCSEVIIGAGTLGTTRLLATSGIAADKMPFSGLMKTPILQNPKIGNNVTDQAEIQWISKLYEKPNGGGANKVGYNFRNSHVSMWLHFCVFLMIAMFLNIVVWNAGVSMIHAYIYTPLPHPYYGNAFRFVVWLVGAWITGALVTPVVISWGFSLFGSIIGFICTLIGFFLALLLLPSFRTYLSLQPSMPSIGIIGWYLVFYDIAFIAGMIGSKILFEKYRWNRRVLTTNKPLTTLQVFKDNIQLYFMPLGPELTSAFARQFIFLPKWSPVLQYILRSLFNFLYLIFMPQYWLLDNLYICLITVRIPSTQGSYKQDIWTQEWKLDPNFLGSNADKKTLADGLVLCRSLMKNLYFYEIFPSSILYPNRSIYSTDSHNDTNVLSDYMRMHIENNVRTTYHLTGSCSMEIMNRTSSGGGDPIKVDRVVDSENNLTVIGCKNIKIVDASTFPRAISTSNSVTCWCIGYTTAINSYNNKK